MKDNLISRQMAIDAVRELYIQSPKINNDIVYDIAIDQAHDVLINLPSAQPETNCSEIPNDSDTISRQAAIDAILKLTYADGAYGYADAKELVDSLEALPSAQPERKTGRMSNKDWIDFLCEQFDISRTSARDMLHGMMKCKKEDNFKRVFNPIQRDGEG